MDEEKDLISKNDLVWVKTKKEIWRGRVLLIPYSKNKEDREYLKIKWMDTQKEDRILIKNVSLNYSKKRVSVPTQQYFNGAYMEETVHDITIKMIQRKKSTTWTSTEIVEGSFNLTKLGTNTMPTFFFSNISEFGGNFEGMLDETNYRSTV